MNNKSTMSNKLVTVVYFSNDSIEVESEVLSLNVGYSGRVIVPDEYKNDKSIIAIFDGIAVMLNKYGDRLLSKNQPSINNNHSVVVN